MKKTLKFICILSVLLIGCTEKTPVSSDGSNYLIELRNLTPDWSVTGFEGVDKDLSFVVSVLNENGVTVEGVEVNLSLTGVEGTISPAEPVTDCEGKVGVVVTVKVSRGSSTGHIIIKAGESTHAQEIEITGMARPATIQIHTNTPVVEVIPDENFEFELGVTLTDENGNGVPNVDLKFSLHPVDPDSAIFGSISSSGSTGEFGVMTVVLNTLGGSGGVIVVCEVEELIGTEFAVSGSIQLTVELLTHNIKELILTINPSYLQLPKDTIVTATIYGRVRDTNNNGIPNMRVNIDCQFGSLANATLTDSTGLATAQYYILPISYFPDSVD